MGGWIGNASSIAKFCTTVSYFLLRSVLEWCACRLRGFQGLLYVAAGGDAIDRVARYIKHVRRGGRGQNDPEGGGQVQRSSSAYIPPPALKLENTVFFTILN